MFGLADIQKRNSFSIHKRKNKNRKIAGDSKILDKITRIAVEYGNYTVLKRSNQNTYICSKTISLHHISLLKVKGAKNRNKAFQVKKN